MKHTVRNHRSFWWISKFCDVAAIRLYTSACGLLSARCQIFHSLPRSSRSRTDIETVLLCLTDLSLSEAIIDARWCCLTLNPLDGSSSNTFWNSINNTVNSKIVKWYFSYKSSISKVFEESACWIKTDFFLRNGEHLNRNQVEEFSWSVSDKNASNFLLGYLRSDDLI